MIEGVQVKRLKVIADERGWLMEMMRDDDPFYRKFGQVYLSVVYPGVVKGWHYHRKQTDHFVFVKGMAKVVLYDGRESSPTRGEINEFFMGDRNPILLVIPPLVLHGIKGIGPDPAYLVNTPTEHYVYDDPDEFRVALQAGEVPYDWGAKDG
jgi:dTDP-4-dehydrorhamnose 3,5-epimerase